MRPEVLVLGASGLLGFPTFLEARRVFGDRVAGTFRSRPPALDGLPHLHSLDLGNRAAVEALLRELRPRLVIGCAGVVKSVCNDAYEAITINAAAPHLVARVLGEWNGRLVQVSTDCVFSGRRGPYAEGDPPDGDDLYGRSKILGEVVDPPHLSARTSFIGFEPHDRRGLLGWFLGERGTVRGFRRALWSGLTADRLAVILVELARRREVTGILHVAGEAVSKDHLLRLLAEIFAKDDVIVEAVDEPRIDRRLDASRLQELGIAIPPLRAMLEELRHWGDSQPWIRLPGSDS